MRQAQIDVLNQTFAVAGIYFNYNPQTVREIEKTEWFSMDLG